MTIIKNNKDAYTAYVNANNIDDLYIGKMSGGDRFSPLGMKGHTIKVSDYFINQKVPRNERENWPILYSNHEIIWVVGYQISDEYQINRETKRILKISVNKE
jgi:tRNA(Ile)-lysidine synthase